MAGTTVLEKLDGRAILGTLASALEVIDEKYAAKWEPSLRVWRAIGHACGFEDAWWPDDVGRGLEDIAERLEKIRTTTVAGSKVPARKKFLVAWVRLGALAAELTGLGLGRASLMVDAGETGAPMNTYLSTEDGRVFDLDGFLERQCERRGLTMKAVRDKTFAPPPPALESIDRLGAALEDLS